jgi:hypothetical protein
VASIVFVAPAGKQIVEGSDGDICQAERHTYGYGWGVERDVPHAFGLRGHCCYEEILLGDEGNAGLLASHEESEL